MTRVGIAATAHYLPERWMTAAEVAAASGIPEDVVVEKFGLRGKHIAAEDEHVSDLAVTAGERLLEEPGIDPALGRRRSCTTARPGRTTPSGRRRPGSPTAWAARTPTRSSTTTSRWGRRRAALRARARGPSAMESVLVVAGVSRVAPARLRERALALHVQLRRRRGSGAARRRTRTRNLLLGSSRDHRRRSRCR